jgi:protein O-GlcNAc transferase
MKRPKPDNRLQQVVALFNAGRTTEAERICAAVLRDRPADVNALHMLAEMARARGDLQRAMRLIGKALDLNPNAGPLYVSHAEVLTDLGQFETALVSYDLAGSHGMNDSAFHINRANVLVALGRSDQALAGYDTAIARTPGDADAWYNRGNLLNRMGRAPDAMHSFDRAIALRPDFAPAHLNRGCVLADRMQHETALAAIEQAIRLRPNYAEAHYDRANVLRAMHRYEMAISGYDAAIALRPDYADAHLNRAIALSVLQRYEAAIASFQAALAIEPNHGLLAGDILHAQMQICDWTGLERCRDDLRPNVKPLGRPVINPFVALTVFDSPTLQRHAAESYAAEKHPANGVLGPIPKTQLASKIRVGYFSANFHDHAISRLMAELFEAHDRNGFEWIGFSFGPQTGDAMQQRVSRAFTHYMNVAERNDHAVAELSRAMGIDVAVDLMGYTRDCRPGIFAMRAAPIQISYLGYPGTSGADYIDYLIGDRTVIGSAADFSEKIITLPHSYQVTDTTRQIADATPSRADAGLPDTGFVYCCFNASYKIQPAMFDGWMRILRAVPGSVLWLLHDNATAVRNLQQAARDRGVDPSRLVFAPRVPPSAHLSRHRAADLFLDTLPYNAHTTASDALWMGLPVLTLLGESFAGRVAASLLHALDMPELVMMTPAKYEAEAIALANDRSRLAELERKLSHNIASKPLFKTALFARHIEAGYRAAYERFHAGLPADHIFVPEAAAP